MEKFETIISASSNFCASLKLPVAGKCSQPHGYTFNVEAAIKLNTDSKCFLIDYNELEQLLAAHCQKLDYSDLNNNKHLNNILPSAENIAKWLILKLEKDLIQHPLSAITIKISTRPQVAITITKHVKQST